jgi:hypothetical protein
MGYHESYSWLAASLLPTPLAEIQSNSYRGLGWAVMKAGGFVEKKSRKVSFRNSIGPNIFALRCVGMMRMITILNG